MIAGLDSSLTPPSSGQADQALAGGVGLWSGYLATRSGVGLLAPWTQAQFDAARRCGGPPLAFCSGWDDPVACRSLAQAWNVRLCLDVEAGIRGDGPWVDGWLTASGAGLYGVMGVHYHSAPFHVLAEYPGSDPGRVWPAAAWQWGPDPVSGPPLGWQWQGSHQEYGCTVDRGWYDDWFGGDMIDPAQFQQLRNDAHGAEQVLETGVVSAADGTVTNSSPWLAVRLAQLEQKIAAAGSGLTTVQAQQLADLAAAVARIEAALKGA